MAKRIRKYRGRPVQPEFKWHARGGPRKGTGRKPRLLPNGKRALVSHRPRAAFKARDVLHVTQRVVDDVPNLRQPRVLALIHEIIREVRVQHGFRLVHFSVQGNHLHTICEGTDRAAFARAMKSMSIRFAKRLNALLGRTGRFFADRFHDQVIETPTQLRNALRYVLQNARRHGIGLRTPLRPDPFSSAVWFTGWRERNLELDPRLPTTSPAAEPRTWVLRTGWTRAGGPLSILSLPAPS